MSRRAATACTALLVLLLSATPAGAARRSVPRGFFGVVADGPLTGGQVPLAPQLRRMHAAGVETVRVVFDWALAQPQPRGPISFAGTDLLVDQATRAGLAVLPVVMHAPGWAAMPGAGAAPPPRDPGEYAAYLAALVHRYGSHGSFWRGRRHPYPITDWQVWNEPNLKLFWSAPHWAFGYVTLLRAARFAVKVADPRSQVVTAGLANGRTTAWQALRRIYRLGGGGLFDAVAVHPYSGTVWGVVETVRRVRRLLRRHGSHAPIMVTETSFSSGSREVPNAPPWDGDQRRQAGAAHRVLRLLAAARRRLGISQVDWYTWVSPDHPPPSGPGGWERYSGLNGIRGGKVVAKPALLSYAAVALTAEGRR